MDDPIPIEGIIEGDPAALAAVCAAGGSAVLAYCSAVGATENVGDTAVAALAMFRRGVAENADQEPSEVERLLLSAVARAARDVAGVDPSHGQLRAGQAALEGAVTQPLAPGLAPRIIRALVEAAPVAAFGGDEAAVRDATEDRYRQMHNGQSAFAPRPAPATEKTTAGPSATATPPPASASPTSMWIPPELDLPQAPRPVAPAESWTAATGEPADAQPRAPEPPAAAGTPAVARPGASAIKRGGHRRFRSPARSRTRSYPGAAARRRNLLAAGFVGLALGAGIGVAATPERAVAPDTVRVRPLDTPFTIDGAVFAVARTSMAPWARDIRRTRPRAGRSWLTLAAQTRNVSRPNFHPRGLDYRLRTAAGIVIGPDTALAAGEIGVSGGRLPIGARMGVHLGFQVPTGAKGLTLEFDPSARGPRIRVPLN